MIIKGHIFQLFPLSGRKFFLSTLNVLLKDFSAYANQVTSQIVSHVENMAVSQNRPLIHLTSSKLPKEQRALEVLKDNPVSEGLICILSVVENCQMSRAFAKLRAHGLIWKIPHSRRYLVSDKERCVMGALIETKRKTYPELAAQ